MYPAYWWFGALYISKSLKSRLCPEDPERLSVRQTVVSRAAAALIGQTAADKKWVVPGKIANRKGRPEPQKKKTAVSDETNERRKSTVSQTT